MNRPGAPARVDFANIGTLARITDCDVPQLGILHVKTEGGTRFHVQSHAITDLGLVVGQVTPLAPSPPWPWLKRISRWLRCWNC